MDMIIPRGKANFPGGKFMPTHWFACTRTLFVLFVTCVSWDSKRMKRFFFHFLKFASICHHTTFHYKKRFGMLNESGYCETMTYFAHVWKDGTLSQMQVRCKEFCKIKTYYTLAASQMHRVPQDKDLLHTCCKSDA
jgi:hypothetical protein